MYTTNAGIAPVTNAGVAPAPPTVVQNVTVAPPQEPKKKFPLGLVIGVTVTVLAAGAGAVYFLRK
jgi:hypothetical protein